MRISDWSSDVCSSDLPAPVFDFFNTQILKQTGLYLQDQVDFGEVASLVLGIRRDRYTKQDAGAPREVTSRTTKRAGLTINVTPTLAPYVSYTESFLPISGLHQFGNTYKPPPGAQKETGIKWQTLRTTMLRLSLYALNARNTAPPVPTNSMDST